MPQPAHEAGLRSAPPCCRDAGGPSRQPGAQQASSDPPHPLAEHQGPGAELEAAQPWLEKLYGGTGPGFAPSVAFATGGLSPDGSKPSEETSQCCVRTAQLGRAARGCCSASQIEAEFSAVWICTLRGFAGHVLLPGEAGTCLALSSPTPRAGTAARSLPGNLCTAPDKEIKSAAVLAKETGQALIPASILRRQRRAGWAKYWKKPPQLSVSTREDFKTFTRISKLGREEETPGKRWAHSKGYQAGNHRKISVIMGITVNAT